MSLVGTYEVDLSISLTDYPHLADVQGVVKTVTVQVDNRCLHAGFELAQPFPLLIYQLGS